MVKITVFAVLILLFVAILADLTLRSETGDVKQQISEVKKEMREPEEKKVQSQVQVNWKKKHERYTYGGEEE